MGKLSTDAFIDGGLDAIDNCTRLSVQPSEPASIANITANLLASVVIDGADFTKANGDVSGRKLTVAQQAAMSIVSTGTATHVAIDDGVDFYVTTCTSQGLTSGGTVTNPAWDIEIADPV